MIVVLTPYTHPSLEVRSTRLEFAKAYAAELMRNGAPVYCPLAHRCAIAEYLPGDIPASEWTRHTRSMLRFASELIIVMLDGWMSDPDIRDADTWAKHLGIPVRYADPSLPSKTALSGEVLRFDA